MQEKSNPARLKAAADKYLSEPGEGERRVTDSAWQYIAYKERLKIEMGTVVRFLFFL